MLDWDITLHLSIVFNTCLDYGLIISYGSSDYDAPVYINLGVFWRKKISFVTAVDTIECLNLSYDGGGEPYVPITDR